jgi:hypothetical protein
MIILFDDSHNLFTILLFTKMNRGGMILTIYEYYEYEYSGYEKKLIFIRRVVFYSIFTNRFVNLVNIYQVRKINQR